MIWQALKKFFASEAKSTQIENGPLAMLKKLDKNLTKNEVRLEQLKKQILHLEQMEQQEITQIQKGKMTQRQERFSLQNIKNLRVRLARLEKRADIYQRNVQLQLRLIEKIEDVQAMHMQGVEEDQIDEILAEFELSIDEYNEILQTSITSTKELNFASEQPEELVRLKAEICGTIPNPTEVPNSREQIEFDEKHKSKQQIHREISAEG